MAPASDLFKNVIVTIFHSGRAVSLSNNSGYQRYRGHIFYKEQLGPGLVEVYANLASIQNMKIERYGTDENARYHTGKLWFNKECQHYGTRALTISMHFHNYTVWHYPSEETN